MESKPEKEEKTAKTPSKRFAGTVEALLESVRTDKDENVKTACEAALIRIADKRPEDLLAIICDYKNNNGSSSDNVVNACLLRVTQFLVDTHPDHPPETLDATVKFAIADLTRFETLNHTIQWPAQEILVSIGRRNCEKIMTSFQALFTPTAAPHYMILNCIGTLATANPEGIIQFVKPCLQALLPTIAGVRPDYSRQAHAFVAGKFCEAVIEHRSNKMEVWNFDVSSEINVVYDVFVNSWLQGRDSKVSSDVLVALAHMFPLLQEDRITDQATKIVGVILNLYRRSIDRVSITQFLSSVIETCLKQDPKLLDPISPTLNASLFDLVIVNPDFEKPQTVKSHYEVLRCFDLLASVYGPKIVDLLLIQLRSNNERERIKSILVVTHLCSTAHAVVVRKKDEFLEILKQMIVHEKSLKMKMVLLKIVVAFAEKEMVNDVELVRFIIKNCCYLVKPPLDHGTLEEYEDFVKACNSSLNILCSTVGTLDDLLKTEILQVFMKPEYTIACTTLAKCLACLFAKNPVQTKEDSEGSDTESGGDDSAVLVSQTSLLPSPESVFVRCLALLGNYDDQQRIQAVLNFLKSYCPNINRHLGPLWNDQIALLNASLATKHDGQLFYPYLYKFIIFTIKDLDDPKFPEILVNKIGDQLGLYAAPSGSQTFETRMPKLGKECGLLLKIMGLVLGHITDSQTVEAKLGVIVETAKHSKTDKDETENWVMRDAAKAIGLASKVHLSIVRARLEALSSDDALKKSSSIFSSLNFMKDSSKEEDVAKIRTLVIESWCSVVQNAPESQLLALSDAEENKLFDYQCRHLSESKDLFLKKLILKTFLNSVQMHLNMEHEFKQKSELLKLILKIPLEANNLEYLPLFPLIIKLTTALIRIPDDEEHVEGDVVSDLLQMLSHHFFVAAQNLKTKFDSQAEDEKVSFIAKHVNLSLPELNAFIRVSIELAPSPHRLEAINDTLDAYLKDRNSEVRICACHVTNAALDVFMKEVKPGVEASHKFSHTGAMLGRIVPRCIDSNATVRQVSVDILRKVLEISCLYETLTVADLEDSWMKELQRIREDIATDDPKEIYRIAGDLAAIVASRLVNLQFVAFCKTLMYCINDSEPSSGIGASIVLKFFTQLKGGEMFHAIPDLVREAICVIRYSENTRATAGVIKSVVALTKHHPKLVCNEILAQPLPYEQNVLEYWRILSFDAELCGTVIDNFLQILSSTCLYEPQEEPGQLKKAVTVQPFAIICALHEILKSDQIKTELKLRFAEIFSMLLTTVATYTNLDPPLKAAKQSPSDVKGSEKSSKKAKFGYVPNRDLVRVVPCQVALDTFKILLDGLEMEQVSNVLTICPTLASSSDLRNFIEILTPLAIGLSNQLDVNSGELKQIVTCLAKYVPSPYDGQRIAAVGLYSQLVTLKPVGEIASVIVLHLNASLNDPNALVRGLCIQGLGCVGQLTPHDAEKYAETSLTALLKGIDDFNSDCLINIPLESMRGLSRVLKTLPASKLENFQISLAIRIKPFFENQANDIREAAILLFGDLCYQARYLSSGHGVSDALREQLLSNLFTFLLHLGESDSMIQRACRLTIINVCALLEAPKIIEVAQEHVSEYSQLNYEFFLSEFVKVMAEELNDHVSDFIECVLPFLKSLWSEIRATATYTIAVLSHFNRQNKQHLDQVTQKVSQLLKDENVKVRMKAAEALGVLYGDI